MGEVYRARDARLDRDVAVKVLPARLAESKEAFERFEREAKAVAALSHPNILAIHDFGTHEGTAYAVMELLEGETLRQRLAAGALPVRKAVDYAAQVARGLAAAHEKGIVHRDLKPENVIVAPDGRVKILDFGLARQTPALRSRDETSSPTLGHPTDAGTVMGTVGYMAPEQVRGEPADHRSDIFSLGCVLHEMVAGQRAFQKPTAAETMTAILQEDPLDGGASESIPGVREGDRVLQWTDDGEALFVGHRIGPTWQVRRLDLRTGRETPWTEIAPHETAGLRLSSVYLTPNGRFWVHGYSRLLTDLYEVQGIH